MSLSKEVPKDLVCATPVAPGDPGKEGFGWGGAVDPEATARFKAAQTRLNLVARQNVLNLLAEQVENESDWARFMLALASKLAHLLEVGAVATGWEDPISGEFQVSVLRAPTPCSSPAATAEFMTRHLVSVHEHGVTKWLGDSEVGDADAAFQEEGWRTQKTTGVALPIRCAGRVAGVLAVYAERGHTISHPDIAFLDAVAADVERLTQNAEINARPAGLSESNNDPFTGLLNRSGLVARLEVLLDPSRSEPVLLVWCDLDDFIKLVEVRGSTLGDEVLQIIAGRLSSLDATASVARVGNDIFGLVVALTEGRSADAVTASVMGTVDEPFITSQGTVILSMSAGDAVSHPGDTSEAITSRAVAAMHEARRIGHGCVHHADGPNSNDTDREWLGHSLLDAIRSGEIRPYFQPIVSLPDESITAFEALARWQRSDGTTVPPNTFIPIAEETGHILELGEVVLEAGCAFLGEIHERFSARRIVLKVNVSVTQLLHRGFAEQVREALERHSLSGGDLCLELTESQAIEADPAIVRAMLRLTSLGIDLAIDDFGTGYSNFAYLTQLPVNTIKLDRSMIAELHVDDRRSAVVRAILSLSQTLGIAVIAEGVESELERDSLVDMGCRSGQGFLWSRAVPHEEALALLTAWAPRITVARPSGSPLPTVATTQTVSVDSQPSRTAIVNNEPSARGCWAYLLAGAVLICAYYVVPLLWPWPAWPLQYPITVLINGSAAAAVAVGVLRWRPVPARPWWLICVGQSLYMVGDVLYYWARDISHVSAYPGVADIFYLARIPFIAVGLTMIIRHRGGPQRTAFLDSAVIALAAGAISWEFLIAPYTGANLAVLVRATSLAYPVMDLMLLALAIRLLTSAGRRVPSFFLLTGGLVLLVVNDSVYGWDNLHEIAFGTNSPIAGAWLVTYLSVGACALHPSMRYLTVRATNDTPPYSRSRLVALGVAALVCPGIIAVRAWSGHLHGGDVILVMSIVIIGLIMVRLAETMHLQQGSEVALRHESLHDPLTGLANRTLFYDRLGHAIQRARREVREVAILLIDLDGFKQINDTMGHSVGDRVLSTSASRLLACSRTPDTVARLGGDEFAILLDGVTTREGCVTMAQRIILALAQPIETEGIAIRTAGSVGVALSARGVVNGDELFNEADIAMYAAKARHDPSGGYHVFDGTEDVVTSSRS